MSAPGGGIRTLPSGAARLPAGPRSRRVVLFAALAAVAAFVTLAELGSGSSAASTPLGEVTWRPAVTLAAWSGYRVLAVESSEDGMVAVATSFESGVWVSADGTSWAPGDAPALVQRVRLAVGSDLAIGQESALSPENIFRPLPRIWRRAGGGDWVESQVEPVDTIRWWIEDVVVSGDTVLLVAVDLSGEHSWIWRSRDGGNTFELAGDPPFVAHRTPIAGTANGFVVVVGDRDTVPAVWESVDGTEWERVATPFSPGWRVGGIAAQDDTVVVIGGGPASRPDGVWLRDGTADWVEVTSALADAGEGIELRGVSAGGAGWAVYGTAGDAVLWLSDDGREWQRVAAEVIDGRAIGGSGVGEWSPTAAAIGGDRIALVGRRGGSRSDVLWVGAISRD